MFCNRSYSPTTAGSSPSSSKRFSNSSSRVSISESALKSKPAKKNAVGGNWCSSPLTTARFERNSAPTANSGGSCDASSKITKSNNPALSGKIWLTVSGFVSQTGRKLKIPCAAPIDTTCRNRLLPLPFVTRTVRQALSLATG